MTEEKLMKIYEKKYREFQLGKITKEEWLRFCEEYLIICLEKNKKVLDNLK